MLRNWFDIFKAKKKSVVIFFSFAIVFGFIFPPSLVLASIPHELVDYNGFSFTISEKVGVFIRWFDISSIQLPEDNEFVTLALNLIEKSTTQIETNFRIYYVKKDKNGDFHIDNEGFVTKATTTPGQYTDFHFPSSIAKEVGGSLGFVI